MARQKVKNGDILEIPLPRGLGFAYAKYIDLIATNADNRYPCLVQIYNLRKSKSLTSISDLEKIELLFSPLLVGGVPPTVAKGKWKIVGNFPISESDQYIPDFKAHEPLVITEYIEVKEWYYVPNADISRKVRSEYNAVKHLENFGAIGADLIPIKIAMGLIMAEKKDIRDYFALEEFVEKVFFNQVQNTPLYFMVPDDQKGKVLNE